MRKIVFSKRRLAKTIHQLIGGRQRRKALALILACALLLSLFPSDISFATETNTTETGSTETDSTDTSTGENAEGESDEENNTGNVKILNAEHGRIQFWQWKEVNTSNVEQLISDDKYTASMLVYYDSYWQPEGFISTYADKQHIFRGINKENYTEFNKYSSNSVSYNAFVDSLGTRSGFDEYNCTWIKLDEDGKSLNDHKEYFKKQTFYTQGGCMGVLWIKNHSSGNNLITRIPNCNKYKMCVNMMLSRESFNTDKVDAGVYNIGLGTDDVTDYQLWRDREGSNCSCRETYVNITSNKELTENGSYFTLQPYGAQNNTSYWVIKGDEDCDLDDLDHSFMPGDHYRCKKMTTNMFINNGYLVAGVTKHLKDVFPRNVECNKAFSAGDTIAFSGCILHNISQFESQGLRGRFKWYAGTPFVYQSLVGEGGDPDTGIGGTYTIHKGELLPVRAVEFKDDNNQNNRGDGTVLPEGSTIIIEEGGVLSVESNLINNGKIINKGGTIIIKEGGCIAPFMDTKEGTINCDNGGNIIVMPNARLFCLSDDIRTNGSGTPSDPALVLSNGSSIINYGLLVNSYAKMDAGSIIENRKDGILMAGHIRTNSDTMLSTAKISGSGQSTSVESIVSIPIPDKVQDLEATTYSDNEAIRRKAGIGDDGVSYIIWYGCGVVVDGVTYECGYSRYSDDPYPYVRTSSKPDGKIYRRNEISYREDGKYTFTRVNENGEPIDENGNVVGEAPAAAQAAAGPTIENLTITSIVWRYTQTYLNYQGKTMRGYVGVSGKYTVMEIDSEKDNLPEKYYLIDNENDMNVMMQLYPDFEGNLIGTDITADTKYKRIKADTIRWDEETIKTEVSSFVASRGYSGDYKIYVADTSMSLVNHRFVNVGGKKDSIAKMKPALMAENGDIVLNELSDGSADDEDEDSTEEDSQEERDLNLFSDGDITWGDKITINDKTYTSGYYIDYKMVKDSEGLIYYLNDDNTMQYAGTDDGSYLNTYVEINDGLSFDNPGEVGWCGIMPLAGIGNSGVGTIRNDKTATFIHEGKAPSGSIHKDEHGNLYYLSALNYTQYMNVTVSAY